jgi:holliday junction DNA helicase RuvB
MMLSLSVTDDISTASIKEHFFADGGSSSKAGMMDYLLTNKPRYLLVDEIDKMTCRDLVLMESGIVSETKFGKTRSAQMITSVFATGNNIKKLSSSLQSRFFIVKLEPYAYEQFCEITSFHITTLMEELLVS